MIPAFPRRFSLHRFASGIAGRLGIWIALGLVVVAVTGLPLPQPPSLAKQADEPYPCQGCPCGCSSAEHCWDRCCCHTDLEKLAWAQEHHVQPPAFLVARVGRAQQLETVACAATGCSAAPSDGRDDRSSCCSSRRCDSDATTSCAIPSTASDDVAVADGAPIVLIDAAAKCRGLRLDWSSFATSLFFARRPPAILPEPLLIEWQRWSSDRAASIAPLCDEPVPLWV